MRFDIYLRSDPYTAAYGSVWNRAPPKMFPTVTGRMFFTKISVHLTVSEAPLNMPRGRRNMLATWINTKRERGGEGRRIILKSYRQQLGSFEHKKRTRQRVLRGDFHTKSKQILAADMRMYTIYDTRHKLRREPTQRDIR